MHRGADRSSRLRRTAFALAALLGSVGFIVAAVGGLLFFRLREGPIFLDLKPRIVAALEARVGHGYHFDLEGTAIEASERGPVLTFYGLSVTDAGARHLVSAPSAVVAVDPLALMAGRVAPTRLEVRDVNLRLVVQPDGEVAVSAGVDTVAVPLARAFASDPVAATGNGALRVLSAAMRSLIELATAPDSPVTALQQVEVSGRLVLDDQLHRTTTVFKNAKLAIARTADGAPTLSVAADGSSGRWSMSAHAAVARDGTKALDVSAENLPLNEIAVAGGLASAGFGFDIPLSAHVDLRIGVDGEVDTAAGSFRLGPGSLRLNDPDHEPMPIDVVTGHLHLDAQAGALLLDRADLHGATSAFTMSGRAVLPRGSGDPWTGTVDASGAFGPERPGDNPVPLDHVGLSFRYIPSETRFVLDSAVATGPGIDFSASADVRDGPDGLKVHGTSDVRHLPAATIGRLWPSHFAASAQAWLLANIKGGVVDNCTGTADLDDADFAAMKAGRPVADGHLRADFAVSGLSVVTMTSAPPLIDLAGAGVITDHALSMQMSHGTLEVAPGRRLSLAEGSTFRFAYGEAKPEIAAVDAHVVGGLDAVADLLGREALKPYVDLPLGPGTLHGEIDGRFGVQLLIEKDRPPRIGAISATAAVTDAAVDRLVGNEGLTDAGLKLSFDSRSGLQASGDGRILGAPVAIGVRKPASGPGEATVALTLDDAARARAGATLVGLKGPVAAKVSVPLTPGEAMRPTLDLDFTRAGIENLVPGFHKPAGQPAHATMTVIQRDGGFTLDDLLFEGNGAVVRGAVDLGRDGSFVSAGLTEVRFSPGDTMRVDARQNGDVLDVAAQAVDLDARPFLKGTTILGGEFGKGALDIELRSASLTGQNGETMTGVDLHLSLRGKDLKQMALTGRLGRQPLTVKTMQAGGSPHLLVHAGDAGACLLFADLYKKMLGGRLDANVTVQGQRMDGFATIQDFAVADDPAARKLAVESRTRQRRDSRSGATESQPPDLSSAMPFRKLEAQFTGTGDIIQVREGSIVGSAFSATFAGAVDFNRDQISLGGVATPIFGADSLLSQLPFLGTLRLNYSITGPAADPTLNVNPM